jgi:hypothetical protein
MSQMSNLLDLVLAGFFLSTTELAGLSLALEIRKRQEIRPVHHVKITLFWVTLTIQPARQAALQRQNAENVKQIFTEKEYRGLSHNFRIHVSVSELYISTMGLLFLLEEICGPILGIYKSLADT